VRRGRISGEEAQFYRDHATDMSVQEMAEKFDRLPETVEKYMAGFAGLPPADKPKAFPPPKQKTVHQAAPTPADPDRHIIRAELRTSEAWRQLKNEFTPDELKYFEECYIKLMSQFKGDVLASEETQIFQAVKFELLMNRNLRERKTAREDIESLQLRQKFVLEKAQNASGISDEDREYVLSLETQLNIAKQAEQSRTNEYVKLQERHASLLKDLKSTRDQRVKQIESSKVSFLGVIRNLMERDQQEREGRALELTKLAGQREYTRLGRPHKYDDGSEDSPILSADTVNLGPEEEESAPADEED
jgi:hypothetical protein